MGDEHAFVEEEFIPSLAGAVLEDEVFVGVLVVCEQEGERLGGVIVVEHREVVMGVFLPFHDVDPSHVGFLVGGIAYRSVAVVCCSSRGP